MREAGDAPLQMVRRTDGLFTVNIAEMDEVMRQALKAINLKYESQPDPRWMHLCSSTGSTFVAAR